MALVFTPPQNPSNSHSNSNGGDSPIIYSVTSLVLKIKDHLEHAFQSIIVQGEISNFSLSASGHYYFTLADGESSISAVLFKMDAIRNPILRTSLIKNGVKVLCHGSTTIYPKKGSMQLIVRKIQVAGDGELQLKFEALKRKLAAEGLFDLDHKRLIPSFPSRVAIITALNGAALQDFLTIFKRRSFQMNILIVPALVQGDEAPASLIKGLQIANEYLIGQSSSLKCPLYLTTTTPVIVLARGGGSIEDLWAFNNEDLARAIYHSPLPVISAVGHQVDYTIADLVADFRAETPSAAAEILSGPQLKIKERMQLVHVNLQRNGNTLIHQIERALSQYSPHHIAQSLWQLFYSYQSRLNKVSFTEEQAYQYLKIFDKYFSLDELLPKLTFLTDRHLTKCNHELEKLHHKLNALDPSQVLKRGYSFLSQKDGELIQNYNSFQKIKSGEEFKIHFGDGIGEAVKK